MGNRTILPYPLVSIKLEHRHHVIAVEQMPAFPEHSKANLVPLLISYDSEYKPIN